MVGRIYYGKFLANLEHNVIIVLKIELLKRNHDT